MFQFLACCALVASSLGNPALSRSEEVQQPLDSNYKYALDVSTAVTSSQYKCLMQNNYQVVFIRGYTPENGGRFDSNSISNFKNAVGAGLATEVYLTPVKTSSFMDGGKQVEALVNGLKAAGISVKRIWIQVSNNAGSGWSSSSGNNMNFLLNATDKIRQLGLKSGIYTSSADWTKITNNYTGMGQMVALWYYNVNGTGLSGETSQDFSDYKKFGTWTAPDAKQFGQNEQLCGVNANRDIVSTWAF